MTGVLIRGGKFGHRHEQGEHHVPMETEVICNYLQFGKGVAKIIPWNLQKELTLLTPDFICLASRRMR